MLRSARVLLRKAAIRYTIKRDKLNPSEQVRKLAPLIDLPKVKIAYPDVTPNITLGGFRSSLRLAIAEVLAAEFKTGPRSDRISITNLVVERKSSQAKSPIIDIEIEVVEFLATAFTFGGRRYQLPKPVPAREPFFPKEGDDFYPY